MTAEPNSLSRLVELAEKQEKKLLGHNNSMKEKERKLTQLLVIGLVLFINALARLPLNLTMPDLVRYSLVPGFLCLGFLILYFAIALKFFYYNDEGLSFSDPEKLSKLLDRVEEDKDIKKLSKLLNERVPEELVDSFYFTNLLEILPDIIAYNEKLQKGLRVMVILFSLIIISGTLFTLFFLFSSFGV